MTLGALASLVSVGLLVFTCFRVTGDAASASQIADAVRNVEIFQKVLIVGVLGLAIGTTYLFWGSEFLGGGQLVISAALFFAPLYLPSIISGTPNRASQDAFGALQMGGTVLGLIGGLVLIADITMRVTQRVKTGVKVDQLKYGKGIKEENDKQNILLGKCWQLPFCRKFVREKCPIYLSRRTCWKELVGCMCEEAVIRGAMENRPIPKDALLAANFIPQNHKLSTQQKKERCYSCIIYNEHQRHKYKIGMPGVVIGFIAFYALGHGLLIEAVTAVLTKINHVVNGATMGAAGNYQPPQTFVEVMLAFFMIIVLTYSMKLLEFTIFKMKI
jgi:hypothetical protein